MLIEDRSVLSRVAPGPSDTMRYGELPEQIADVWHPEGPSRALVVIIHGGFWRPEYDRTHTYPMAVALREAGYTACSIEYRRVPGQPDQTTQDVRMALATVPKLIGAVPVLMIGHSAGGHLALWSATNAAPADLAGTVALAPVADLALAEQLNLDDGAVRDFIGADAASRADLDPARMPDRTGQTVIIHGDEDEIVPIRLAESYLRTHSATRLVALPGVGHFAVIDPESPAWATVLAELAALVP